MRRILASLSALAVLVAAGSAFAQVNFPTQSGIVANGVVEMCLDQSGTARPCDALAPRAVKIVGGSVPSSPYPTGAIPITGIGSGTTGAVVGTLAAAPSKTTYICGFDVSAIGGTAAIGPIVVAGLTGGSFTYQASASAAGVIISREFNRCIPGAVVNGAITITTTADGTATAVNVNAYGFQL